MNLKELIKEVEKIKRSNYCARTDRKLQGIRQIVEAVDNVMINDFSGTEKNKEDWLNLKQLLEIK